MKEIVPLVIAPFLVSNFSVNGFSVDLIHRDSPLSPFYNTSMNQTEIFREAALRSIARTNNFSYYFTALSESKVESVMIPYAGDYLMKIFIGSPPKESLVVVDTGSDLIWVQCWPCTDCYKQEPPLFKPTKSYTYKLISCHTDYCKTFFTFCGEPSEQCGYSYSYEDNTRTVGTLAKDVIGIGNNAPIETIFGCGRKNKGLSGIEAGIAGLSASKLSLVSQLGINGRVFSYCLIPPYSKKHSKITFQPRSTLAGQPGAVSTLMVEPHDLRDSGLYFVRLKGISIDNDTISPTLPQSFDMLIDSGTALTYLETRFYQVVETTVVESINDEAMRFSPRPFKLCYRGATKKEVPDITFHFFGGADVRFPTSNMFYNVDKATICFMVLPHPRESILGNLAQVNFKVEYDREWRRISFAPTDCTKE